VATTIVLIKSVVSRDIIQLLNPVVPSEPVRVQESQRDNSIGRADFQKEQSNIRSLSGWNQPRRQVNLEVIGINPSTQRDG
jgi:hypothetical protein